MRVYAVRLNVDGKIYRISTDRVAIDESGTVWEYLPLVVSVAEPTFEIALDSASPIPSYEIELWDATRDLIDGFNELEYESVECEVFVVENKVVSDPFFGYMADVNFGDGVISFSVRADESTGADEYLEKFEADTFQYFQVFSPYGASTVLDLKSQPAPWTLETKGSAMDHRAVGLGGLIAPATNGINNAKVFTFSSGASAPPNTIYESHCYDDGEPGSPIPIMIPLSILAPRNSVGVFDISSLELDAYNYSSGLVDKAVIMHADQLSMAIPTGEYYLDSILLEYGSLESYLPAYPTIPADGSAPTEYEGDPLIPIRSIKHEPPVEANGMPTGNPFQAGDGVVEIFEDTVDTGGPLMVKRAGKLVDYYAFNPSKYGTGPSEGESNDNFPKLLFQLKVKCEAPTGGRNAHDGYIDYEYSESNNNFYPRVRTLFKDKLSIASESDPPPDDESNHEPHDYQCFLLVGSPQDVTQILIRCHWAYSLENGEWLSFDLFYPIKITPLIRTLLDNEPDVRPVFVDPDNDGEWTTTKDDIYVKHNNFIPSEGSSGEITGLVGVGISYERSLYQVGMDGSVKEEISEVYPFLAQKEFKYSLNDPYSQTEAFTDLEQLGLLKLEIHHQSDLPDESIFTEPPWELDVNGDAVRDIYGYVVWNNEPLWELSAYSGSVDAFPTTYPFLTQGGFGIAVDEHYFNEQLIWNKQSFPVLALHQFQVPSPHPYSTGIHGFDATLPHPDEIDVALGVDLYSFQWILVEMKLRLSNLSGASAIEFVDDGAGYHRAIEFDDRMQGLRYDLMMEMADIIDEGLAMRRLDSSASDFNEELLKQATEKFAICTGSSVMVDPDGNWYEKVSFSMPEHGGSQYRMLTVSGDQRVHANRVKYTNRMLEPFAISGGIPRETRERADRYFKRKKYRVIRNPVPENGADLGMSFPLAYGKLEKVPLLHVMGTKVMANEDLSSGDDVYIYSANPVKVSRPEDIDIWLGEEIHADAEEEMSNYNIDFITSPFPKVLHGDHYEMVVEERYIGEQISLVNRATKIGDHLDNPFFKLIEMETLEGSTVFGIKLRGGEHSSNLGRLDKRFPIRNGVGSTPLFASFTGHELFHPLDIIEHYLAEHGQYPFSQAAIDQEYMEKLKSQTRRYEASVFIENAPEPGEFITNMCRQFGFWWCQFDGQIKFTLASLDEVDYSKPLIHNLNIGTHVTEDGGGYKDIHNRLTYRYRKDRINDDWEGVIHFDDTNNRYCQLASRAKSQLQNFEVDAEYVNSAYVARDVATRLAKIHCSKKITYKLEAKNLEGIEYAPGDVVPMTYPPYGIYEEPVLVQSVTPGRVKAELTVVRFPGVFKRENPADDFIPSVGYQCDPFVNLS